MLLHLICHPLKKKLKKMPATTWGEILKSMKKQTFVILKQFSNNGPDITFSCYGTRSLSFKLSPQAKTSNNKIKTKMPACTPY